MTSSGKIWPSLPLFLCFTLMGILFSLTACTGNMANDEIICPSITRWDLGLYPQKISVSGNRLVNASGNQVVLHGVSHFDPTWQAMGEDPDVGVWNESLFDIMKSWHVDLVRLPIHPAVWRRYGADEVFAVIDQAIDWCEEREMYAIIDFHSIGFPPEDDYMSGVDMVFGELYETTTAEIQDFWNQVSTKYATQPIVAFYELFNEPARDSAIDFPNVYDLEDWSIWKNYVESIVDIIRANDPDTVILVGGFQFAYDLTYLADSSINKSNIAYSVHIYPDSNWKLDWETAFGRFSETYPLVATEFGYDNSIGAYSESNYNKWGGEGTFKMKLIEYFEEKNISWTAWSFSIFEPALFSDTEYEKPSDYGNFIKCVLVD